MNRYFTLDGLRGIAAVMVVFHHVGAVTPGALRPASAYLAVDFFFLLSGFVIAKAYDARLRAHLSTATFMKIRVIRLYPLYLLALGLAMSKGLVGAAMGMSTIRPGELLGDFAFGAGMLPSPLTIGHPEDSITPLNSPAWSLLMEMAINLAFAATFAVLMRGRLVLVVVLSGILLVYFGLSAGSLDVGRTWSTLHVGLLRVTFSFLLGVAFSRYEVVLPGRTANWFFPTAFALLACLICDPGPYRSLYDLGVVLFVFPAILLLGASVQSHGQWCKALTLMGDVSYAIYIVHGPIIEALAAVQKHARSYALLTPGTAPILVCALILLCLLLDRIYDLPVRRFLTARLARTT
ncbi:MAG: acyltransferase [Burkholderiaceae bacterium]